MNGWRVLLPSISTSISQRHGTGILTDQPKGGGIFGVFLRVVSRLLGGV